MLSGWSGPGFSSVISRYVMLCIVYTISHVLICFSFHHSHTATAMFLWDWFTGVLGYLGKLNLTTVVVTVFIDHACFQAAHGQNSFLERVLVYSMQIYKVKYEFVDFIQTFIEAHPLF